LDTTQSGRTASTTRKNSPKKEYGLKKVVQEVTHTAVTKPWVRNHRKPLGKQSIRLNAASPSKTMGKIGPLTHQAPEHTLPNWQTMVKQIIKMSKN